LGAAETACRLRRVVLSDRSIREELASGGIVIEPLGEKAIQPSSVDVHVDRYFRVFRNDTTPYIDPKQAQEDLTELVEVEDGKSFILHPGEFVLGSTLERVALGTDLVARLEGKSSLGRLGLLIHSSLPASERVMVLADGGLEPRPIGEVVRGRLPGRVVAFDADTFEVGYHEITGWYEGPPDRIYEIRLASGRRVRVTAGHNLFTLDRDGRLAKTRTLGLVAGTRVAIPREIPEPPRYEPSLDLRSGRRFWQIHFPISEHKLLTTVPLPDRLLVEVRKQARLDQVSASRLAGYRNPTDLANIENRTGRDALRLATLRRLRIAYARRPECRHSLRRLDRLVDGGLLWDRVVEVRDTGDVEPIFDLEVRPQGRKIENFLAGQGGVFVSNTAGFVDAGWDGHLTLELSNVANLPIAIYPGMKIGQISFLRMTSEAETPYGSETAGSKYKGQRGPTPSRYYLNFQGDD
jgi:deoxycytidine triphosphate deaminase